MLVPLCHCCQPVRLDAAAPAPAPRTTAQQPSAARARSQQQQIDRLICIYLACELRQRSFHLPPHRARQVNSFPLLPRPHTLFVRSWHSTTTPRSLQKSQLSCLGPVFLSVTRPLSTSTTGHLSTTSARGSFESPRSRRRQQSPPSLLDQGQTAPTSIAISLTLCGKLVGLPTTPCPQHVLLPRECL